MPKPLQRHDRIYGCILVRGRWEDYGVNIDLGITPRSYLTIEGRNRYYLCLKFNGQRWLGYILIGISNDEYADSEKQLTDNLIEDYQFSKNHLQDAQIALLTRAEQWVAENDGGANVDELHYEDWQRSEVRKLEELQLYQTRENEDD